MRLPGGVAAAPAAGVGIAKQRDEGEPRDADGFRAGPDGSGDAGRRGDAAKDERSDGVAAVTPQPVDAERPAAPGGIGNAADGGDQVRVGVAGFCIAGLFVVVWAAALAYWRWGNVEARWTTSVPPSSRR